MLCERHRQSRKESKESFKVECRLVEKAETKEQRVLQSRKIVMVSIRKGPRERRHGTKRRDEEKSATQEENCNSRTLIDMTTNLDVTKTMALVAGFMVVGMGRRKRHSTISASPVAFNSFHNSEFMRVKG